MSVEEPKSPVRTLSLCLGGVNDTSFFSGYRSHPSALQLTQLHEKPAWGLGLSQRHTEGAEKNNTENPGLQILCPPVAGDRPMLAPLRNRLSAFTRLRQVPLLKGDNTNDPRKSILLLTNP